MLRKILLILLPSLAISLCLCGQTGNPPAPAPTPAVAMPSDPRALMLLAARSNGLATLTQPWHVEATYQTFNADGKPLEQGVFDEWWSGPDEYKISYMSPSFSQTEYMDHGQRTWTGNDKGAGWLREDMVHEYLTSPLPKEDVIAQQTLKAIDKKIGTLELKCLQSSPKPDSKAMLPPTACLNVDIPLLRLTVSRAGLLVFFNDFSRVGEHYIAKQITVKNGDLSIVSAQINQFDLSPKTSDSDFASSAASIAAPLTRVEPNVIAGKKLGGDDPRYPSAAKTQRIQGTVILAATIGADGIIGNLEVISGPKALQDASYDAVKTWRYEPYLLEGKPVPVQTTINVTYTLGD